MAHGIGRKQSRIDGEQVMDKRQHLSDEGLSMSVRDMVVEITLTDANNSAVILPSVSEAMGGIYVIRLNVVGTGAVTLSDNGNDAALSDITLNAAGESTVLYSDGVKWNELQANYS